MAYLFSKSKVDNDGQTIIPSWATERWARQAGTMYDGLSDSEKDSDRKEADRFLALLEAALAEKDDVIEEFVADNEMSEEYVAMLKARIAELEREVDVLKYGAVCVQAEPKEGRDE